MLNPEQIAARENKLTASRVACLMTGDAEKIYKLWQEMIGDPAFVPEDFSNNWPVNLGIATEALNLDWFARKHGEVTRRGEVVVKNEWMACTLDGWSKDHGCPIECKHVGGREAFDTVRARYMPQMTWQMIVTDATQCAFSVIEAANAPIVQFVPYDTAYATLLIQRASDFMRCVEDLVPPVAQPPVEAPVIPLRIYPMTGNNVWAANAVDWLANKEAKKIAERAEKELKAIVPADAARCHGHGIQITRSKGGLLYLREEGAK